jgi:DNA polymerase-3 subunit epsilon
MTSFAVIDFETTGLVPERIDRVVEAAVVLTASKRPDRGRTDDLGQSPSRHRGLAHSRDHRRGRAGVPDFRDIGDHLLGMLNGRAVSWHDS